MIPIPKLFFKKSYFKLIKNGIGVFINMLKSHKYFFFYGFELWVYLNKFKMDNLLSVKR